MTPEEGYAQLLIAIDQGFLDASAFSSDCTAPKGCCNCPAESTCNYIADFGSDLWEINAQNYFHKYLDVSPDEFKHQHPEYFI